MKGIRQMSTPRLEGVIEQFQRARSFLEEAQEATDRLFRFRHLVAAVYFASGMASLLLECARMREFTQSKNQTSQTLWRRLSRYGLVMKLRANDYHRFGLAEREGAILLGPITMRTGPNGPEVTGDRTPLQMQGDLVFDEWNQDWISIEDALSEYLEAVPDVLREFNIDVEDGTGGEAH